MEGEKGGGGNCLNMGCRGRRRECLDLVCRGRRRGGGSAWTWDVGEVELEEEEGVPEHGM